jgi:hypothetical protein
MDRVHLLVQLKIKKWKNGKKGKMDRWEEIRRRWGKGRRSAGDGAGEEIRRRWGKGRDSRWLARVPGGGGMVASPRKKKTTPTFLFSFFYIFIRLTSGSLSISAHIEPAQHL